MITSTFGYGVTASCIKMIITKIFNLLKFYYAYRFYSKKIKRQEFTKLILSTYLYE